MTEIRPLSRWGDRRRARVGLLGGSFNPAHDGHRHVALTALGRLGLDQVWLLVSPQNPLKGVGDMASLADRLASARQILGRDPRLRACALESAFSTRFTADTLAQLRRRFPRIAFVWLMGADNLAQMPRWRRWRRIYQTVPVAVFARSPYSQGALASMAAHRFARFRRAEARARGLAGCAAPAWCYVHARLHPASATAIRAQGLALGAQTKGPRR